MTLLFDLNGNQLNCSRDLDCNTRILNSYCQRNQSSCVCERGYRYYTKFKKCIFSNNFHCSTAEQCANLDPRLTCIDSYCTCKEKEKRTDNYLCSTFRKYCYKGYRYNVDTTDCVFVGDLTINQIENLDQSVEIFVIVLFFITSLLFIASCINNYQNERREKLRRRIARQQTLSLFAEQRRRMNMSPPIAETIPFSSHDHLFRENVFFGYRRYDSSTNANRNHRYPQTMMEYMKPNASDDLPPSYEECMKNCDLKIENSNLSSSSSPSPPLLNNSPQEINFTMIEEHFNIDNLNANTNSNTNIDTNHNSTINNQSDQCYISRSPERQCDNLDNQMHNQANNSTMNDSGEKLFENQTNNTDDHNTCQINENDCNNNIPPVNIK